MEKKVRRSPHGVQRTNKGTQTDGMAQWSHDRAGHAALAPAQMEGQQPLASVWPGQAPSPEQAACPSGASAPPTTSIYPAALPATGPGTS